MRRLCLGLVLASGLLGGACNDSKPSADGGLDATAVDQSAPSPCLEECTRQAPFLCVKDSAGDCIECEADEHCIGNPDALGNTCGSNNYCTCKDDSACIGRKVGAQCDTPTGACSCHTDADCANGLRCVGNLGDFKICDVPCQTDADCTSNSSSKCDANSGACVACLRDDDCTSADTPHCDPNTNRCAQCLTTAHCAGNVSGQVCDRGVCTCNDVADCSHPTAWGQKCVSKTFLGTHYRECGCTDSAECAQNHNGPACYGPFSKCSCQKDSECLSPRASRCSLPYDAAAYAHCQPPCSTNDDCAGRRGLPICRAGQCVACVSQSDCPASKHCDGRGQCVACLTDQHCTSATAAHCSPTGACVQCLTATDCETSLTGSKCSASGTCGCESALDCGQPAALGPSCLLLSDGSRRCGCASNAECSASRYGALCSPEVRVCSCIADSDCHESGFGKCGHLFAEAPFKSCREPCTDNTDCHVAGLAICQDSVCVGCATHSDCTYNRYQTVCAAPFCAECLTDVDCRANPDALGNTCNSTNGNYCICSSDADCVNNKNGKRCDLLVNACSCQRNDDCPNGTTCTGTNYFGMLACQ